MDGQDLTAVGLALDIVGAFMLWKFVVEISFADEEDFINGKATLALKDPSPDEIKAYKRRKILSRSAIFILMLGFALQLVGNYVP